MESLFPIISWGAGIVLSIGVVWAAVEKFSPKIKKAVAIARHALDLLDTVVKSVEDKKLDTLELETIKAQAEQLMAELK